MAKTLTQLNAQIAKLQKEVEAVKAKEAIGVIERIKEAIAHYGLTAADLGFSRRGTKAAETAGKVVAKKKRKKMAKKPAGVIRYRDEAGNTWTGHGKRPRWYLAALESGKTPEDLEVN
ncbi:H-NS family nucleoid-associated regulatory protein [Rhodoferax sediminis]|uniref:H-NS histone family protein n=1 Tax=Rhodoferax sediminis TaxID=2509614 RepID=A0A515D8B3_9BURK|nr:H-NS histone family protein [Rhodoferax sediminis]QDL36607.1 H-NS histone family protein [Rhodoferax sediminis]